MDDMFVVIAQFEIDPLDPENWSDPDEAYDAAGDR